MTVIAGYSLGLGLESTDQQASGRPTSRSSLAQTKCNRPRFPAERRAGERDDPLSLSTTPPPPPPPLLPNISGLSRWRQAAVGAYARAVPVAAGYLLPVLAVGLQLHWLQTTVA